MATESQSILTLQESARVWPLLLNMTILCIHSAVLGCALYFTSLTVPYHKESVFGYMLLSDDLQSWLLSLFPLTMLIVSHIANLLAEWLGRKKTLLLSNCLTILSMAVMYFASNAPLLLIGRAIGGFGTGTGIVVAFVYVSEIATIKLRPVLSTVVNASMSVGTLILYLVNMVMPPEYLHFFVIGVSFCLIVLQIIFSPESPQWLVRKGRLDDASAAYRLLRGKEYAGAETEIREIQKVLQVSTESNKEKSRWLSRRFLHPLGILVFLKSQIGFNGLGAPIYMYGPSMFSDFGLMLPYEILMIVIPTGGCAGYFIGIALFGCMRKKTQFITASAIMAISSGCLAFAYYIKDNLEGYRVLSEGLFLTGALGIPTGYGAGIGAVIYSLPGELLAPEDKAVGVSTSQSCRFLATFVAIKIYPYCIDLFGYPAMFTFHGTIQVIAAMFVIRFLPETRNKSIEELDALFRRKE